MRIASGQSGELRTGYQVAAQLGPWAIDLAEVMLGDAPGWTCSARIIKTDAYWLEHGEAFDLRLDVGRVQWRWRNVNVHLTGESVLIRGEAKPELVRV